MLFFFLLKKFLFITGVQRILHPDLRWTYDNTTVWIKVSSRMQSVKTLRVPDCSIGIYRYIQNVFCHGKKNPENFLSNDKHFSNVTFRKKLHIYSVCSFQSLFFTWKNHLECTYWVYWNRLVGERLIYIMFNFHLLS